MQKRLLSLALSLSLVLSGMPTAALAEALDAVAEGEATQDVVEEAEQSAEGEDASQESLGILSDTESADEEERDDESDELNDGWDDAGSAADATGDDVSYALGEESATDSTLSSQATDVVASGTCGSCQWTLDSDGLLTLSAGELVYEPLDITNSVYWPWQEYRDLIREVRTEAGVIAPENSMSMFSFCSNLTYADLSNMDMSRVTSIASLFYNCVSLSQVNVRGLDFSNLQSANSAFYGCESLTAVDVSDWATDSLVNIAGMFEYCASLEEVDLFVWDATDTGSVDSIFYGCSSLKSLDLSGWKTSGITSLCDFFKGCKALESISVEGWDVSSVERMDWMFSGCESLTSLEISEWDTSRVTSMQGMFENCKSLPSLDISNWDTSSVISMQYMFENCQSLESLNLGNWNTANLVHAFYVFYGCSSLVSLDLSSWNTEGIIEEYSSTPYSVNMFEGCSSLESITVGDSYAMRDFPTPTTENGKWWSTKDRTWLTREEIISNRERLADTYTNVVSAMNLSSCSFTLTPSSYTYDGTQKNPTLTVKDGTTTLVEGTDYDVTTIPDGRTSPGTYTYVVTGRGDYTGSNSASFTITRGFRVRYDANGGVGTPSEQIKQEDVALVLSSAKPTRTYVMTYNASGGSVTPASKNVSCSFEGWNTQKDGGGTAYSSGGTYIANADATLYAQWTNPAAGTLATPLRSGYVFDGWYTSPSGGQRVLSSSAVTGNLTLYAHWSDPYNLGDETYSFDNYGDADSQFGHCFGMSITSSGYHVGALDLGRIGGSKDTPLYTFADSSIVREPICHYQAVQGSYSSRATVAGGSYYLGSTYDISTDWQEVVDYVKDHSYDNTGLLQIGFRKNGEGGHAINFIRYENVDGQDRIYAYDNNFPNQETYFYQDSYGRVYQTPVQTFAGEIDCIALRDVRTYFEVAGDYDASHVIYVPEGFATVLGYAFTYMETDRANGEYVMYEIPSDQDRVTIIPNRDNADFIYMDTEYSFGEITSETRGELRFASKNEGSSGSDAVFTVYEGDSSVPAVTLSESSFIYDGTPHKPNVTVELEGGVLRESQDYTVEYLTDATNAGEHQVKVTLRGSYSGSVTKTFVIKQASQVITASDKTVTMGKTVALDAKTSGDSVLTYESSNAKVARVSSTGVVTPVSVGTTEIMITAPATPNCYGGTRSVKVTVTEGSQTITASNKNVAMGKTVSLGAKASGRGKLTYKSSNSKVAKVGASGVVTPVKVGTVKITITAAATAGYKSATKTVTVKVVRGVQTITASNKKVQAGKPASLGAKTSGDGMLTYKSSNAAIATVNAKGVVSAKKAGTVKITVIAAGTANYRKASKTVTVTVTTKAGSWKKAGTHWRYVWKDGAYPKSVFLDISGKTYYFDASGYMVTGWKKIGGKRYYFDSSGAMVKGKWVGNYWLKADGTMARSQWVDGGKYYVGSNGIWVKGMTR